MKKTLLLTIMLLISSYCLLAQVPAAFNYQAVVRDQAGQVITNQNVTFKISILQESSDGTSIYSEKHAITTNSFGLVNLLIGKGQVLSGTFSPLDWGKKTHFLKVEFDADGGTAYQHLVTTQLLSVPYAFHAQTVENDAVEDADANPENELQTLNIADNQLSISEGNSVSLPENLDNDASNELQTLSISGNEVTISNGNSINLPDDADTNATNEIQQLSLDGSELTLSNGGGTVTIPAGEGGDNWGSQKVITDGSINGDGTNGNPLAIQGDLTDDQTLTIDGNQLSISEGNTISLPDDPDEDATNEIQQLSLDGSELSLSNGGGTVTIPAGEGGDNWGSQKVVTDATIEGDGTNANPLSVDGDLTDDQTLTINGNELSISGGNSVNLPEPSESPWQKDIDNLSYSGTVSIGTSSGSPLRKFESITNSGIAIAAQNNHSTYASVYARNYGTGPAGDFRGYLKIEDGTQGEGKVLTSDTNGKTSWTTLASSPWSKNESELYYNSGNIGIGTDDPDYPLDIRSTSAKINLQGTNPLNLKSAGWAYINLSRYSSFVGAYTAYKTGSTTTFHTGLMAGKSDYWISTSSSSLNGLKVEENGDVEVTDEVHTTTTGDAHMLPIAYGTVTSTGNIYASSSNFTVSTTETGRYEISINGAVVSSASHIVTATINGSSSSNATGIRWTYLSGKLRIYTLDSDNNKINSGFSFVVYEP